MIILLIILFRGITSNEGIIRINNMGKLSKETEDFLISNPVLSPSIDLIQRIYYNQTTVDEKTPFVFRTEYYNGDLSVAPEELFSIVKNNKRINSSSYSIDYNHTDMVYFSQINTNNKYNASAEFDFFINIPDPEYVIIEEIHDIKKYTKRVQYFRETIGLKDKVLYAMNNNYSLSKFEVDGKYLNKEKIKDFWVFINNADLNNCYLIVLNENSDVIVFKFLNRNDLTFKYNQNITISTYNSEGGIITINEAVVYNQKYVLASSKGMLIIDNSIKNDFKVIKLYENINFTSLHVYNTALYAMALHLGLYIFDLFNITQPPTIIKHPNMLNIDYSQNPFTGNDFIGILLDTSKNTDEFFIELLIKNPFELVTNAVYCLKGNNIKSYTTPDAFFSYFYNKNDNRIYRIRRGILNRVNQIIYSIQINQTKISEITSYYNPHKKIHSLSLLSEDSFQIINFIINQIYFFGSIQSTGLYTISFSRLTDACASNLGKPYSTCKKIINFKIQVIGYQFPVSSIIIISVCSIAFIIIVIVLILSLAKYTNCFKKNNLKLVIVNKSKRSVLYEELESEEQNTVNLMTAKRKKEEVSLDDSIKLSTHQMNKGLKNDYRLDSYKSNNMLHISKMTAKINFKDKDLTNIYQT